jgi:uncharacterized protein
MAWFIAVVGVLVASQLARLLQADPLPWLVCDYAGRLGALALLMAIPRARAVAFQKCPGAVEGWKLSLPIFGLVVFDRACFRVCYWLLPGRGIGIFPAPHGWLRLIDLTFGLALVAFSEEIVFRRCARHVLEDRLGSSALMVIASSVLFASYHWTFGMSTIAAAGLFGAAAMVFYIQTTVIWPVVIAHYLADVVAFY